MCLRCLIDRDLILRAGIEVPTYVHHHYAESWLVKIPIINWNNVGYDAAVIEDENIMFAE